VVVAAPPAAVQARPLCINCGTVEAVNAVQQAGTPGGLGALAGGVLGAVVGNQVGQGGGRTLATVLGAVGGGLAGNTVEKGMNKSIQYEVRVRMEDGSVRNLQQATPVAVGDKVLLDNGVLRPAPRTSPDALNHSVVGGQSAPVRLGPSN
jgi:outer membrane lipoprotein SlyB